MPLTLLQKTAIRRHLGYPTIGLERTIQGGGSMGLNIGLNYFEASGRLEFAMNNIPPFDEATLTGYAYGAIGIFGSGPNAGDQVSATLSGGPLGSSVTVTATAISGDTNTTLALKLGALGAQNTTLQDAGIVVLAPYGVGVVAANQAQAQPLAEISFTCSQAFSLSVSSTGATGAVISSAPAIVPPQSNVGIQANGQPLILNGFIPILNYLEGAWPGATQNQDTREAGEWKASPKEEARRRKLYDDWCERLGDFLMVPQNPFPASRFSRRGGSRASI